MKIQVYVHHKYVIYLVHQIYVMEMNLIILHVYKKIKDVYHVNL